MSAKAKRALAVPATSEHPAIFREGNRLVAGAGMASGAASVATESAPVTHMELASLVAIVERLVDRVQAPPPAPAAVTREIPWASLQQASDRSGLSVGFLERLVQKKKLRAVRGGKHGAWAVRVADVDALVETL